MHRVTRIPVVVINPMLTCKLCNGYLIDATTIVECLHSFCRSCILSYLKLHTTCPICDTLLHKTRPHYAIRPDRALQAMVYKLIPNLFEKEMSCRREFFKDHPTAETRSLSPEKKGEITLNAYVLQEEEHISIELEYWQPTEQSGMNPVLHQLNTSPLTCRSTYLLCPPDLTVAHLEKLIRVKFGLEPNEHKVALFFATDDLFRPEYTLSDLACLYSWRRLQPMKLFFTILEHSRTALPSSSDSSLPTTIHTSSASQLNCLPHSSCSLSTTTTTKSHSSPTLSVCRVTSHCHSRSPSREDVSLLHSSSSSNTYLPPMSSNSSSQQQQQRLSVKDSAITIPQSTLVSTFSPV
ncbi:hypothetical protein CRM22_009769 [Opisthorchis felineus]|uniref:RING-type domain-containing protein n=1 Tax=Opisthorchis felineus TaxID=147828 RepID=A0A4S2L724_OPIFE|nr:hypothetical protein CRM22_009769 [Opisthorchis felineus]